MDVYPFPSNDSIARYIVLDVESLDDKQLYHRYRSRDPRPAQCRWPFRRIVAATVMAISIENGIWEVENFRSFTGGDDRELVRQLFSWFTVRPRHRLVTWGGLNEDSVLVKTAAMEAGMKLPMQLRHLERDRGGFLHLDLAKELKAGSGQFVHLSEIATRLRLPWKMAGNAGKVPHLALQGRFREIAWLSESDVLTTALVLASHLATLGRVTNMTAAQYATVRHVRERRSRAPYHRELGNYLARFEREMMAACNSWLMAS